MTTLIVGWDSNIDELGWGVGITESNDWNVHVGSFLDSLSIGAGVGDDNEAGFLKGASDVVGEVTGGKSTSNGNSTSVSGKFQDSALAVGTSGDDTDVCWVVDSCDDTGSEDDLLPGGSKLSVLKFFAPKLLYLSMLPRTRSCQC